MHRLSVPVANVVTAHRLYATYCAADKRADPEPLPAIERYESTRIVGVHRMAESAGAQFGILSGEFGLLPPSAPIPYYDRLLAAEDVSLMAERVAETLTAWAITEVRWFSVAFEMDPHVTRYRDAMAGAADRAGASFELEMWEPPNALPLI